MTDAGTKVAGSVTKWPLATSGSPSGPYSRTWSGFSRALATVELIRPANPRVNVEGL